MIPVEVGQPSDWQEPLEKTMNDQWHKEDLEFLHEIREQAHLRNEKHKALIAQIANKTMKLRSFPKGTLVLHQVDGPRRSSEEGKLAPNWEGTFKVKKNL